LRHGDGDGLGILRAALQVVLSYWLHPFRARFTFARMGEIFRFSRWMMLQNLAGGVNDKLPAFVVGREWGSSALAFFNMGREIAALATTEIRAPIRRALFPGLAQIGRQPLCFGAAFYALGTNSHLTYLISNRAYLTAASDLIRLLLLLPAMIAVVPAYGVTGVAYAIATINGAMVAADYVLSPRILHIEAARFVAAVRRPVVASLAMCIVVWLAGSLFAPATDLAGHAMALARSTVAGAATYVGTVLGLWFIAGRPDGAERRIVSLLAQYRDRRRRS
jgi:O-antigen/teichoic acid export membrane protein